MSKFRYKVTAPCYFDDVYRTPTKHSIVVRAEKFHKDEKPSYLELLPDNTAEIEEAAEAAAKAMTIKECKEYLDEAEVDYDPKATVAILRAMVDDHKAESE